MADKDMNGATIAVIVIVSVLVLALIVVLIVQAVNYSGDKTIYVKGGNGNGAVAAKGSRMRVPRLRRSARAFSWLLRPRRSWHHRRMMRQPPCPKPN